MATCSHDCPDALDKMGFTFSFQDDLLDIGIMNLKFLLLQQFQTKNKILKSNNGINLSKSEDISICISES